jgi:hypothetical protein
MEWVGSTQLEFDSSLVSGYEERVHDGTVTLPAGTVLQWMMPTGNGRYVSEFYKLTKECNFFLPRVDSYGESNNRWVNFNGKTLYFKIG